MIKAVIMHESEGNAPRDSHMRQRRGKIGGPLLLRRKPWTSPPFVVARMTLYEQAAVTRRTRCYLFRCQRSAVSRSSAAKYG
jgi:hypothetical protein